LLRDTDGHRKLVLCGNHVFKKVVLEDLSRVTRRELNVL